MVFWLHQLVNMSMSLKRDERYLKDSQLVSQKQTDKFMPKKKGNDSKTNTKNKDKYVVCISLFVNN